MSHIYLIKSLGQKALKRWPPLGVRNPPGILMSITLPFDVHRAASPFTFHKKETEKEKKKGLLLGTHTAFFMLLV